MASLSHHPVLTRFRTALASMAQASNASCLRLARGTRRVPTPDYDVAVFLIGMADCAEEMKWLADISTDIFYDSGELIHAMPFPADAFNDRTPLMHEIRVDGVEL